MNARRGAMSIGAMLVDLTLAMTVVTLAVLPLLLGVARARAAERRLELERRLFLELDRRVEEVVLERNAAGWRRREPGADGVARDADDVWWRARDRIDGVSIEVGHGGAVERRPVFVARP